MIFSGLYVQTFFWILLKLLPLRAKSLFHGIPLENQRTG